jgi:hypothetical protein
VDGGDEHVLEHGEVGERPNDLVRAYDAGAHAAVRGESGDRTVVEQDLPRGRALRAGDHAEQRGLAGAVGTDDAEDLALAQVEVDAVEGAQPAEPLGETAGLEQRHHT